MHRRSSIGGLVITRREGEKILVNHGEIIIEIAEIRGRYVKLAFVAHKEISLIRAEAAPGLGLAAAAEDKN